MEQGCRGAKEGERCIGIGGAECTSRSSRLKRFEPERNGTGGRDLIIAHGTRGRGPCGEVGECLNGECDGVRRGVSRRNL